MKKLLLLFFFLILCIPVQFQILDISELKTIEVEIKGHVVSASIYTLQKGDTIKSLLDLAGIYEDSDLRSINQTQILHNQDVIVIQQIQSHLVSINSASIDELMSLPGIGETTALKIIEYRQIQSFQTLEDLMNVKGIGQKKFEALKGLICL